MRRDIREFLGLLAALGLLAVLVYGGEFLHYAIAGHW
jgi:hypothetical protein